MTDDEWRWRDADGKPGLTPDQYFRLGELAVALPLAAKEIDMSHGVDLDGLNPSAAEEDLLGEVLDELLEEEGAIERWQEGGDPAIDSVLNAMLADPDDYGPHLDDLSNLGYDGETDLTGLSFAAQAAGQGYGGQPDRVTARVARHLGRMAAARGDWEEALGRYAEAGPAGHPVEMANRPGRDSDAIELAQYQGDPCGAADAFGRCASAYHDVGCSHVQAAGASYGMRPQDSAAWQAALRRHAALPAADSDGRSWRTGNGWAATFADHFESLTGVARRSSPFEPGPDADRAPAVIQRDPGFPSATRDAAAAFIARYMPGDRPKDADWQRIEARMDPRRQAATARMQSHPDFRWPRLQAERAERERVRQAAARQPVQLSQPMTAADGEDVYSAVCGSLGPGIGAL